MSTFTEKYWEEIKSAFEMILQSSIHKIEGRNWMIYRVGEIIRIDIKVKQDANSRIIT